MHLSINSILLISSVFVFASTSSALPVGREGLLLARFTDSDSFSEVKAQGYSEAEFDAGRVALSKLSQNRDKSPTYRSASRDLPREESDYSNNHKSLRTSHDRRSSYASYDEELVARGSGLSAVVCCNKPKANRPQKENPTKMEPQQDGFIDEVSRELVEDPFRMDPIREQTKNPHPVKSPKSVTKTR